MVDNVICETYVESNMMIYYYFLWLVTIRNIYCCNSDACVISSKTLYKVGENVTISCNIASADININRVFIKQVYLPTNQSENIENKFIPEVIQNNVVQHVFPFAEIGNSGTYWCYETENNTERNLSPLTQRTICVIKDVQQPKSFACILMNYDYLLCSWETNSITFWKLQYRRIGGAEGFKQCQNTQSVSDLRTDESTCSLLSLPYESCNNSRDNSCKLYIGNDMSIFEDYIFRLNGCTAVGNEIFDYNVSINDAIVKLNPVTSLSARPCDRSLNASWVLPYPPDSCLRGINCSVQYGILYNKPSSSIYTDVHYHERFASFDNKYDQTMVSYLLPNVLPLTNYSIKVSCKPAGSKYWSDTTSVQTQTEPDVPLNGPKFVGFSYYQCWLSAKCLTLYWQDLDPFVSQGAIGYLINVTSGQKSNFVTNVSADGQSSDINIQINQSNDYKVYGWTLNSVGYSKNSSYLYIPVQDKVLQPTCVRYTYNDTQKKYNVSYETRESGNTSVNVKYYWCQGVMDQPSHVICQNGLNWTATSHKSILIDVPHTIGSVYFAVSISKGALNYDMVWKKCKDMTIIKEDTGISIQDMIVMVVGSIVGVIIIVIIIWYVKCYKFLDYVPHKDRKEKLSVRQCQKMIKYEKKLRIEVPVVTKQLRDVNQIIDRSTVENGALPLLDTNISNQISSATSQYVSGKSSDLSSSDEEQTSLLKIFVTSAANSDYVQVSPIGNTTSKTLRNNPSFSSEGYGSQAECLTDNLTPEDSVEKEIVHRDGHQILPGNKSQNINISDNLRKFSINDISVGTGGQVDTINKNKESSLDGNEIKYICHPAENASKLSSIGANGQIPVTSRTNPIMTPTYSSNVNQMNYIQHDLCLLNTAQAVEGVTGNLIADGSRASSTGNDDFNTDNDGNIQKLGEASNACNEYYDANVGQERGSFNENYRQNTGQTSFNLNGNLPKYLSPVCTGRIENYNIYVRDENINYVRSMSEITRSNENTDECYSSDTMVIENDHIPNNHVENVRNESQIYISSGDMEGKHKQKPDTNREYSTLTVTDGYINNMQ